MRMYIILEGMPGTGKTTLAQMLTKKLEAKYLKSVISDTVFGNCIKKIRDDKKVIQLENFLLSDLAIDELRVNYWIKKGNVIRDKALTATLGHLSVHGYENKDIDIQNCLDKGYKQIIQYSIIPDIAVLISANKDKVTKHFSQKGDISDIDSYLVKHYDIYLKQEDAIRNYMRKIYQDRFFEIESFSGSVDEMIDMILKKVKQDENKRGHYGKSIVN